MKRYGHLFEKFVSYENLDLAERKARKGKGSRYEVRRFLENREENLQKIKKELEEDTFVVPKRKWKRIFDPKERWIGVSKYNPVLIVQYALLNILEPIFMKQMISTTYSCIKGRGIHPCSNALRRMLKEHPNETVYALQLDISKCYDNVRHEILRYQLMRFIKDEKILNVIFKIVESEKNLVIGDHISSWLCNIYLSQIDHSVKEKKHVRFYVRYADDIVILSDSKEFLWDVLSFIERELLAKGMHVKHNASVYHVEKHGINFIGYVFYHDHTLLRKRIKVNMMKKVRMVAKKNLSLEEARAELAGHWGWLKHCDSKNLQRKICKIIGYENLFKQKTKRIVAA